jgi:hypothetical protein
MQLTSLCSVGGDPLSHTLLDPPVGIILCSSDMLHRGGLDCYTVKMAALRSLETWGAACLPT